MKRLTAAVLFLVGTLSGCGGSDDGRDQAHFLPKVVTTTTIVADVVRHVGGDDVEVVSLMGPGVDPHLYKPSAGDVRRMAAADIVFFSGLHLEGKMGDVLGRLDGRGVPSVAVTSCMPEEALISISGTGAHDPHVWFDVNLWREAITCVRDALRDLDPDAAQAYAYRAEAYSEELRILDLEIEGRLATIPVERRVLVTAHDAFAYFGRAYGLQVRGLLGVSTASEAGAVDVQELADLVAEQGIPAVFVETSVSPRYIRALREAVAARGMDVAEGGSLYS
ncbi:MAG: zinc ABC transporter substrate-binding protein, partial [Thermoanaerobaculales bacterium]|nr:zinc ABC transporter substrate-binding protein [Thermoanaerobaculales bacterium]